MKIFYSRMTKDGIRIANISTVPDKTSVSEEFCRVTPGSGIPLSTLSPRHQVKLMRGESIGSDQLWADVGLKA